MNERDGYIVEMALDVGFTMTNDDGDEYACTEAQLLEFWRRSTSRIEKLEAALDDVAGYLARADWYYLKPETRETLEPQSYRGQQDDSALKADHPTALSAEDIRKMNHE